MDEVDRILGLIDAELAKIDDRDLVERIRELLVTPQPVSREWDYGAPSQTYVCWTVLEHPASNTGVAYCESGFGPSHPWGLVWLSGPYMSMGMDSGWYPNLEDAVRESMFFDGGDDSDKTNEREA